MGVILKDLKHQLDSVNQKIAAGAFGAKSWIVWIKMSRESQDGQTRRQISLKGPKLDVLTGEPVLKILPVRNGYTVDAA
jgi:hypothetical protein